jgi:hypothetical protein
VIVRVPPIDEAMFKVFMSKNATELEVGGVGFDFPVVTFTVKSQYGPEKLIIPTAGFRSPGPLSVMVNEGQLASSSRS